MRLFHYTCDHWNREITRCGYLKPGLDGLVWMTDLEPPAPRLALGLTSYSLNCDRLQHAFEVEQSPTVQWWIDYRKTHPELRVLELDGTLPMHWYVSESPVPVIAVLS